MVDLVFDTCGYRSRRLSLFRRWQGPWTHGYLRHARRDDAGRVMPPYPFSDSLLLEGRAIAEHFYRRAGRRTQAKAGLPSTVSRVQRIIAEDIVSDNCRKPFIARE